MWKTLERWGRVEDVHIARSTKQRGQRFDFIRYKDVQNPLVGVVGVVIVVVVVIVAVARVVPGPGASSSSNSNTHVPTHKSAYIHSLQEKNYLETTFSY